LFLINAPWIFKPLFAMMKPWVDTVTIQKFHVCYNEGGASAELLK
jgi:hypothetical protein